MDKKTAVVTGASGGIGAELCKKLGAGGWCAGNYQYFLFPREGAVCEFQIRV